MTSKGVNWLAKRGLTIAEYQPPAGGQDWATEPDQPPAGGQDWATEQPSSQVPPIWATSPTGATASCNPLGSATPPGSAGAGPTPWQSGATMHNLAGQPQGSMNCLAAPQMQAPPPLGNSTVGGGNLFPFPPASPFVDFGMGMQPGTPALGFQFPGTSLVVRPQGPPPSNLMVAFMQQMTSAMGVMQRSLDIAMQPSQPTCLTNNYENNCY